MPVAASTQQSDPATDPWTAGTDPWAAAKQSEESAAASTQQAGALEDPWMNGADPWAAAAATAKQSEAEAEVIPPHVERMLGELAGFESWTRACHSEAESRQARRREWLQEVRQRAQRFSEAGRTVQAAAMEEDWLTRCDDGIGETLNGFGKWLDEWDQRTRQIAGDDYWTEEWPRDLTDHLGSLDKLSDAMQHWANRKEFAAQAGEKSVRFAKCLGCFGERRADMQDTFHNEIGPREQVPSLFWTNEIHRRACKMTEVGRALGTTSNQMRSNGGDGWALASGASLVQLQDELACLQTADFSDDTLGSRGQPAEWIDTMREKARRAGEAVDRVKVYEEARLLRSLRERMQCLGEAAQALEKVPEHVRGNNNGLLRLHGQLNELNSWVQNCNREADANLRMGLLSGNSQHLQRGHQASFDVCARTEQEQASFNVGEHGFVEPSSRGNFHTIPVADSVDIQDRLQRTYGVKNVAGLCALLTRVYWKSGGPSLLESLPPAGTAAFEALTARRAPKWTRANVTNVRFTHASVAACFQNGVHAGEPVSSLVDALEHGKTKPDDVPLACIQFEGTLFSLFNERLFALREFAARVETRGRGTITVPVFVAEADPLTAKFALSFTTETEGVTAELGCPFNSSVETRTAAQTTMEWLASG
eukprot:TRINITY_DN60910_c0_g1_i1.p1 TRINITY_DN60910_c0_g1~~TRINITY_DN60910_c0_g1_i1.p1  ORF type:complete len:692 (+),score=117.95 TRINITY_DN60910_c0_g1_i1:125-2077(+)